MKRILLITVAASNFMLSACTSMGPRGVIALGSNAKKITWTPEKVEVEDLNNGDSFREGTSTLRSALAIWGATSVAKSLTDAYRSTTNATTAAGVAKVRSGEITKRAAIGADVQKTAILNPVETVPPVAP